VAFEIPHEVAMFLNFLGVPYPDIDEDQIRELAGQVRAFATSVASTHESATAAVRDMGSVYSGYSYGQLVAAWARMSVGHTEALDQACRTVAKALDVAADVITVVKAVVLAELAALAAGYTAVMASMVVTAGWSAALTTAFRAAASRLLSAMEQMLISYIAIEVISRAMEPLADTIERKINGFVYDAAREVLGVTSPNSSAQPLHIDPNEVIRYADLLDNYADDIREHAARFVENVAGLDFATANPIREPIAVKQRGAPGSPSGASGSGGPHDVRSPIAPELPREFASPRTPKAETTGTNGAGAVERHEYRSAAPGSLWERMTQPGGPERLAAASPAHPDADVKGVRTEPQHSTLDRPAVWYSAAAADGSSPVRAEPKSEPETAQTMHAHSSGSPAASDNVVRDDKPVQHPPASTVSNLPGTAPSSGADPVVGDPRRRTGPEALRFTSGALPTPWDRSGPTGSQSRSPASTPWRRGARRRPTPQAARESTARTPSSDKTEHSAAQATPDQTNSAAPRVFAPAPAPARSSESPDRRTESEQATSDAVQRRSESAPPGKSS